MKVLCVLLFLLVALVTAQNETDTGAEGDVNAGKVDNQDAPDTNLDASETSPGTLLLLIN